MKNTKFLKFSFFIFIILIFCSYPINVFCEDYEYEATADIAPVYSFDSIEFINVKVSKISDNSPAEDLAIKVEFKPEISSYDVNLFYGSDSRKLDKRTNSKGCFRFVVSTENMKEGLKGKIIISAERMKPFEQEIEIVQMESKRLVSEIFVGASFANDYEKDGESSGISESDKHIWVKFDSLFNHDHFHIHFDASVTLSTYLSKDNNDVDTNDPSDSSEKEDTAEDNSSKENKGRKLADAAIVSTTLLIEPEFLSFYYDSFIGREKEKFDVFKLGFFTRPMFITRKTKDVDGDSNIFGVQSGFSIRYHKTDAKDFDHDLVNKSPDAFLEIADGWYEEFAGSEFKHRFVLNGGFRVFMLQKDLSPVYGGFNLNLGEGEDEFQFYLGLLYELEKVAEVFNTFLK